MAPLEEVLSIRAYANTEFVNTIVKKPLYEKVEERAKKLETTPDKLIYNAILSIIENLKLIVKNALLLALKRLKAERPQNGIAHPARGDRRSATKLNVYTCSD